MSLRRQVICNVKNPSHHCKVYCLHGQPHYKDKAPDINCERVDELCALSDSKRKVKVHCRRLTKKEIKFVENTDEDLFKVQ